MALFRDEVLSMNDDDDDGSSKSKEEEPLKSLSPPPSFRLNRHDSNSMPIADLFGGGGMIPQSQDDDDDDAMEVPSLRTIRRGNPWMSSFYSTASNSDNNNNNNNMLFSDVEGGDEEDTDTVVMEILPSSQEEEEESEVESPFAVTKKKRPTDNYPAGKEETSPIKFDFHQWRNNGNNNSNNNNNASNPSSTLDTILSFDSTDSALNNNNNNSPTITVPPSHSRPCKSKHSDHEDFCTGTKVRKLHIHDPPSQQPFNTITKRLNFIDSHHPPITTPFTIDTHINSNNSNNSSVSKLINNKSPTDIFGFPSLSPGTSTPTRNSTNTNTRQAHSPTRTISKFTNHPPETPMIPRHAKSSPRTPHYNDNSNTAINVFSFPSNTPSNNPSPKKSRFDSDFEIISVIGDGSFGTVYKCRSKLDGCKYAIKETKRAARGPNDRDRMLKEVYALAAICDQSDTATFHIVRYHQAWMDDDQKLYIQTELCTSTLSHEILQNNISQLDRRYKLLREILLALEFIHRNKMVHLDIKPDNIFIKDGKFKLGDFGLASKHYTKNQTDKNNTNKNTNHYYYGDIEEGDSRYMSLDLLREDHHDLTKSDVFSLGATMYEICINRPLPSDGQEWQDIRNGKLAPIPNHNNNAPEELQSIIVSMMIPSIDERPSASNLLKKKQLLSEEQKLLQLERTKVLEAKMALAAQQAKFKLVSPPPKKTLIRANTWNGLI